MFGKCLTLVFQVCFRSFSVRRSPLQVKTIIAATTGRFYEWVSVFLEKGQGNVSCGTLSMVVAPK